MLTQLQFTSAKLVSRRITLNRVQPKLDGGATYENSNLAKIRDGQAGNS